MRIALYHNLPSGGAKRALFEMTRLLVKRHDVDLFSLTSADEQFADLRPLVRRHHLVSFRPLPLLRPPLGWLNQLIYLANLSRLDNTDRTLAPRIDGGDYDVAFVHACRYRQAPAVLRYLQTPTIYFCQEPPRWLYDPPIERPRFSLDGTRASRNNKNPLRYLYRHALSGRDKLNVQRCTRVLANSHHSLELLWRVYGRRPKVCYLGVNCSDFQPQPYPKDNMVLSVGSIQPLKGHDLLVEAIARVETIPQPVLCIVSNQTNPDEKAYLTQLAARLGTDLRLPGMVYDSPEMAAWYSRAKVTGVAAVLEPLGLTPLESMACGTPVVGIREGGIRETVLDGVTGYLTDRDPKAFARALDVLLSRPEHAAEMGRSGQEWVKKQWTWDHTVASVEEHLADCATQPR